MLTTQTSLALQVNGDAFISRTYDNGDDFKRLDFNMSEVSSSAPWVKVSYTTCSLTTASHAMIQPSVETPSCTDKPVTCKSPNNVGMIKLTLSCISLLDRLNVVLGS